MIDAYLVSHPRALDLHYYLGRVREQNGLVDEAITSYRNAAGSVNILGPSPAVMGAKLSLALLLKKKGDNAGAAALFDELSKQWAHKGRSDCIVWRARASARDLRTIK
jgi:TolA-binding protein